MRQYRRWPGIDQGQQMRLTDRLRLGLTTQTHPTAHLPRGVVGERHAADTPAHCQVAGELRRHIADIRQLLAFLDRFDRRSRLGSDIDRRLPRRTETALHQGDHLTVLHRTA
ncbi:hypothetical protein D9M68_963540 [compost metagenome]